MYDNNHKLRRIIQYVMQRQPRLQARVHCIEMGHPSWVSPIRICIDDVNGLDFGDKRFTQTQLNQPPPLN